jgi:hypothetical protein
MFIPSAYTATRALKSRFAASPQGFGISASVILCGNVIFSAQFSGTEYR